MMWYLCSNLYVIDNVTTVSIVWLQMFITLKDTMLKSLVLCCKKTAQNLKDYARTLLMSLLLPSRMSSVYHPLSHSRLLQDSLSV